MLITALSWSWSPANARGRFRLAAKTRWYNDKPTVLALREIAEGLIDASILIAKPPSIELEELAEEASEEVQEVAAEAGETVEAAASEEAPEPADTEKPAEDA